jgi:hypothetical protein
MAVSHEDAGQALYRTLQQVGHTRDAEVLEGYQRYIELLQQMLAPEQIATYAALIERLQAIPIADELTPVDLEALSAAESIVLTNIAGDQFTEMENRRVAALITHHRQQAQAEGRSGEPEPPGLLEQELR